MLAKSREFIFVRCSDKKTAQQVGAHRPPEVIVLDCEGEQVGRWSVSDAESIVEAMTKALDKYSSKEIEWEEYGDGECFTDARDDRQLVLLLFSDGKKDAEETMKALEDRSIAKHHEKFLFVKAPYSLTEPLAKRWTASASPTVLIIDPARDMNGTACVLERLTGKQKPIALRLAMLKALAKVKAAEKAQEKAFERAAEKSTGK